MIFRKILLILSLQFSLFANSVYNLNLLDFQAKVFPKIIISDNNFENKLVKNKIILSILYEDIDYDIAEILKDKIEKNYSSLKDYTFEVEILKYNEFDVKNLSTAYLFLLGKKEKLLEISKILENNNRLSFAYDDSYLKFGLIFGLTISSKIDIFLNIEALKNSKIELQNSIFSVIKIK
ncbi:hypothetical protein [Aliarcobacter cibarius]|uniref:YfiR family protein n=1 Tax=Aliarcobacter cibarius TaxID=255507 RepID=A0A7L5JMA2_9BACT|nr:hypothetical protein [Aliarcobacter cibarius]QKJ26267.1 hypothetical protein ACBT_0289 [Aliarcobacter cibarius]TLS96312.1 hypothetical protein FE247_09965 [Aliarcobacter cibarius]TLS96859.1 hypothetical protein FE245_10120 [Aliarcobacter cibarius]TLT02730.1 hypothetical protein FE248_09450 [Aliarcobacter cibarius]